MKNRPLIIYRPTLRQIEVKLRQIKRAERAERRALRANNGIWSNRLKALLEARARILANLEALKTPIWESIQDARGPNRSHGGVRAKPSFWRRLLGLQTAA